MTFFPPVSERDLPGVEELENQTSNLLSFREIAKPVFGTQVAFNLLTGYGEGSRPRSRTCAARLAPVKWRAIWPGASARTAIQVVQAPVFYGYAFAAYAEFAAAQSTQAAEHLADAFTKLGVKVAEAADPGPTNVSVAGESEIHLARIEPDPNVAAGFWLWGAVDNLRLASTNAVRIAEELLAAE